MNVLARDIDRLIGDHGAQAPAVLEAMMAEYEAPVYRLALSILRDAADAQDAAQEAFVQAAAGLHRYQVGTNFRAWLFKITVNTCRMMLRKRGRRRLLLQAWEALTNPRAPQPGVEAQVVQGETRSELWRLVDELDEKHRLVVVMRLGHDMAVAEISELLGVNEKTVYTRLYQAMRRLRGQMRLQPELAQLWDEVQ